MNRINKSCPLHRQQKTETGIFKHKQFKCICGEMSLEKEEKSNLGTFYAAEVPKDNKKEKLFSSKAKSACTIARSNAVGGGDQSNEMVKHNKKPNDTLIAMEPQKYDKDIQCVKDNINQEISDLRNEVEKLQQESNELKIELKNQADAFSKSDKEKQRQIDALTEQLLEARDTIHYLETINARGDKTANSYLSVEHDEDKFDFIRNCLIDNIRGWKRIEQKQFKE